MRNKTIIFGLHIILCSIFLFNKSTFAQEENLKKEVQVVRPYEPSISDAFKINLQPKIEDTIKVNPNFTYGILQRPINTYFTPVPISAARMVSEPLPDLYSTLIRVGLGTNTMPLFEAYYNSKRNQDFMYGAWVQHHSSMGKVKLENGEKVDAKNGTLTFRFLVKKCLSIKFFKVMLDTQTL